jgi:hypothetical protein
MEKMYIGSEYRLSDRLDAESRTLLGYKTIVIKERVLSRTETRSKSTAVEITSYHYTLLCLVNGNDSSELDEGQLQEEIMSGYYELLPVNQSFLGSK